MYNQKDYQSFIAAKSITHKPSGIDVSEKDINQFLFPFQRDLVRVALKVGRFCIWANTGLGKTLQQLSWSDALVKFAGVKRVLVLAPLGVAKQTVDQGDEFGITVKYCFDDSEVVDGINITNYDRLHKFNASQFDAIVLDESSIIKDSNSATRNLIIDTFRHTPYKLACSATPSPNDYTELGNQCEFLGVMTREEMLSMYFTHDGGDTSKWRLKNHARRDFWKFVCSWAVMIRMPSDMGYSDDGYVLPELQYITHAVDTHITPEDGKLIFMDSNSLNGQRHIRKTSMSDRCQMAADLVNNSDEQWLVWCETNEESSVLSKLINDCVEVKGSDKSEHKENSMHDFGRGEIKCLVTKPSIAGMGMNWQICHNVIYIGLTHSFEMFYQSVRRVWRYGQLNEVSVHIIQHQLEGAIAANLKRKEHESLLMGEEMIKEMSANMIETLTKVKRISVDYNPNKIMIIPDWLVSEN
jgi:Helicase conserved C-terminal domain/SNF2-related domain